MLAAALGELSPETWRQFLAGRRWFPAGARAVRLIGAAPVGEAAALALLAVEADRPWVCQALLVEEAGPEGQDPGDRWMVAAGRRVVEASDAPAAFSRLGPALRAGGSFEGRAARWSAAPIGGAWPAGAGGARRVGGEQSNSSVVLGESALFKLFRRVEVGSHPELEIGRYLTARGFGYSPPLLSALTVETADGVAAAGSVHVYLPGRVDGWARAISAGAEDMSREAATLGAATRALHEALAADGDGPLAPRAVLAVDRARWAEGLRAAATGALERLRERSGRLRPQDREIAGFVAERGEGLIAEAEARLRAAAGVKIRIHGDYHLGQVLFDAAGGAWSILDFEGEPSRPLAERALRQLPLRDVAGMLRSFAYAALVGGGGARWEQAVSAAFLAGYDAAAAPGSPLPPAQGSPLLAACVVWRAFYELGYELDYRPEQAWIPLTGLAAAVR